jgi:hypothetical protein
MFDWPASVARDTLPAVWRADGLTEEAREGFAEAAACYARGRFSFVGQQAAPTPVAPPDPAMIGQDGEAVD